MKKEKAIEHKRPSLFLKAAPIINHEVKKSAMARKLSTIELTRPPKPEKDQSPRQLQRYKKNPNKLRVHRPSASQLALVNRTRTISPAQNESSFFVTEHVTSSFELP